jgi:uncharacterized protein (TIGR02246 family)
MDDIRNAISAANERFMDAFRRSDAAAIASLYTDDAKLLPPGSEMVTGRGNIEEFWRNAMNMGIRDARLEIDSVESAGDMACEVSRFHLTGDNISLTGKYVVVWKNDDGWKLHVDIWNMNE